MATLISRQTSSCLLSSFKNLYLHNNAAAYCPSVIPKALPTQRAGRLQVSVCAAFTNIRFASFWIGRESETDQLPSDVRDRTIRVIDSCRRRVTVGDVASRSGMMLREAERALQAIAADTNGFLEVSNKGFLVYGFPSGYRLKLAQRSFKMKFEPLVHKGKNVAALIIRASFGTALLSSIVLVFSAVIIILSGSDTKKKKRSKNSSTYSSRRIRHHTYRENSSPMSEDACINFARNFFESVFSFVFGDENPNQGIEEERWKLIGEHIASNGGVVVAEEIIPYLDIPLGEELTGDESYIFPVLLRYDGHPEIDDEGNILYIFPLLQRSTISARYHTNQHAGQLCTTYMPNVKEAFKERTLNFSKTSPHERALVAGLGALNVTGVLILQYMLMNGAQLPTTQNFAGNVVHFVVAIFPLLQTNKKIEERNIAREKRALALERPAFHLQQKLRSARDMARKIAVDEDQIIYNTKDGNFTEEDRSVLL